MVIDSHVHLKHGDQAATEYTAEQIVATMDSSGIDRSVVFAISTTTPDSIGRAADAVDRFPDRLIAYAFADPSYDAANLSQLRSAVAAHGFRGIKVHLGYRVPEDDQFAAVVDLAGELEVPCLVDFAGRADIAERMAWRCPEATILVAHLGRYLCRDEDLIDAFFEVAAAHPNVVLDASGVVLDEKIAEAVARFGAGRVVFGTDGPHTAPDTVTFAHRAVAQIRSLDLPADDERAVLGGSIAGLLNLR